MASYIVSYDVLRDFCFIFLRGGCTLFTYHGVWQEIMADAHVLDFKRMLLYYHWRFACCSFLNLLDINYEEGFCCAICGKDNSLHTVICDAKAPSSRQELCTSLKSTYSSPSPSTANYLIFYDITRHRDRVYLAEKHVRQMMDQVGRDVSKVTLHSNDLFTPGVAALCTCLR
ncbi:unnamed protein product [Pocillopora meandrina]|uniref:Uncharacterized protein n=1 Tax=Pocillopora meandrina TaxID=46732 RepID=A0AAU9XRU0_9CNID|nr:unnamed protein product [Pocillopora meandrina]